MTLKFSKKKNSYETAPLLSCTSAKAFCHFLLLFTGVTFIQNAKNNTPLEREFIQLHDKKNKIYF